MSTRKKVTGVFYHPLCREHGPGEGHPECPARFDAALAGIRRAVPPQSIVRIEPASASDAHILLCHTPEYLASVKRDVASGFPSLETGDTDICGRSLDAAYMAVGCVVAAVDAVVAGNVANAFCVTRPPGHHATPSRGMGFCIFNNVAIGVRHAQRAHGVGRALVVDWDVHHGNGTQEIFSEDPSVFYFSVHQWPLYPGTGRADDIGTGAGRGFTLNCPFASGSGRVEILGAFQDKLLPAMRKFRPEIVFVSAGFDSRVGDRLGQFTLDDGDFAEMTRIVLGIAREYGCGRVISCLEGGYSLEGLASAVGAHVRELAASAAVS